MSNNDIKKHFDEALEVLSAFNTDENLQKIEHAIKILSESINNGNKISAVVTADPCAMPCTLRRS